MREKINWSEMRSLKLSKVLTYSLIAMLVVAFVCIPFISKWYISISTEDSLIKGDAFIPVCIMLVVCDLFGLAAANALRGLIGNIGKSEVFIEANSNYMRLISWCCIFVGCTFTLFGAWRISFFVGAFFAFFMGIVMRVLKNVFEKAVSIKNENDLTV
ncbi:MAG: DUF2975 domain-containing protein [Firmicutes bacterium]|nr:DUF2975 domain-containing protein [Bacillota bacterium]